MQGKNSIHCVIVPAPNSFFKSTLLKSWNPFSWHKSQAIQVYTANSEIWKTVNPPVFPDCSQNCLSIGVLRCLGGWFWVLSFCKESSVWVDNAPSPNGPWDKSADRGWGEHTSSFPGLAKQEIALQILGVWDSLPLEGVGVTIIHCLLHSHYLQGFTYMS